MAAPTIFGASALVGTAAAEVTNQINGSTWGQLVAGSATAVVVACIGLYATVRRRKNGASEDLNALTIARTVEQNFATFRAETNTRLDGLEQRTGALEDHARPWRKEH